MYRIKLLIVSLILCFLFAGSTVAQQVADPNFKSFVENPTFTKNYPRVLFDEAHNNFHTSHGRYKPFVDLITSDGYNVMGNLKPFTRSSLETFKILIIVNALGAEEMDEEGAERPAFTEEECDAVRDWVKRGGSLLLIADHAPFGGAAESLAKRFGIEMSKGFVFDAAHSLEGSPSILTFTRENKLMLDHPITRGRNDGEKVDRIVAFTGQALKVAEPNAVFMKLGEGARDKADRTAEESVAVGGQAQGLALKFGKGRVVALGEAAMLSAQVAGPNRTPMGMNVPGNDNRQLALNIMHWLSGVLK
ncbi:MAG TPA: hypothetical protein VIB00_11050 [Pyrinomonadaceae bacterium]|jgi:hypothetical protein